MGFFDNFSDFQAQQEKEERQRRENEERLDREEQSKGTWYGSQDGSVHDSRQEAIDAITPLRMPGRALVKIKNFTSH